MKSVSHFIQKNGPELQAFLTEGLPRFVTSSTPPLQGDGIPVFCYHLVESNVFEADLLFMDRNGYSTITADELLLHIQNKTKLKESAVALTFDDGAVNFYQIAFPLLKAFQTKAILFVAPGLHRDADQEKAGTNRPCTWEELREMHDSGWVDIQSHTWAHRSIPDWPDPVPIAGVDARQMQDRTGAPLSLADDLRRSRQMLETEFNKTVRHLAWPRYRGGREALRLALSAGYEGLWTGTVPGHPLNKPGQSPLEIVRLSGEFLRRMPGEGRESLLRIMKTRYAAALRKKLLT